MKAQDFNKVIDFLNSCYQLDFENQVKWHEAVLKRYADHMTDDQFYEICVRKHEISRWAAGDYSEEETYG